MNVDGVITRDLREERHGFINAGVLIDDRLAIRIDYRDDRVKIIGRRCGCRHFGDDISVSGS